MHFDGAEDGEDARKDLLGGVHQILMEAHFWPSLWSAANARTWEQFRTFSGWVLLLLNTVTSLHTFTPNFRVLSFLFPVSPSLCTPAPAFGCSRPLLTSDSRPGVGSQVGKREGRDRNLKAATQTHDIPSRLFSFCQGSAGAAPVMTWDFSDPSRKQKVRVADAKCTYAHSSCTRVPYVITAQIAAEETRKAHLKAAYAGLG